MNSYEATDEDVDGALLLGDDERKVILFNHLSFGFNE
jgi:hypothetical protein